MNKDNFNNYLMAGHGRCYELIRKEPEKYHEAVMHLCTHDTSFDMQCEGSRALYAYDLTMLFDDIPPFVQKIIQKFLSADIDMNWHEICHLCDMLILFAFESNIKKAKDAIWTKYKNLHNQLMTKRWSAALHEICQGYEYIAIGLIRQHNCEYVEVIVRDIGAWFIRRKKADRQALKWQFSWLWHSLNDEYGDIELNIQLKALSQASKEISRFYSIMSLPDVKRKSSEKKITNAEKIIAEINSDAMKSKFEMVSIGMLRMENDEKLRLANAVVRESNNDKKAELLSLFTFRRMIWPLDADHLISYAASDNTKLQESSVYAMTYIQDNRIGKFAREKLLAHNMEHQDAYIQMLVNNFCSDDEKLLLQILNSINIDSDEKSGWHGITLGILNSECGLPNSLYMWIYENSLCSCCRRDAVEILIGRGAFPSELRQECLHDCNMDIRELFMNPN